jgi:phosphohistidine phosphatase
LRFHRVHRSLFDTVLVYLLRHADADTVAPSDDERFLSEKGMMQAQRVARFCEAHAIRPDVILTSPLRRAHQTATVFVEKVAVELRTVLWLSSGAAPENIVKELREFRNLASVMLVGHEPDFSQLAAYLIGAQQPENIRIRKASLTLFSINEFTAGCARLEYSLPVKLL